MIWYEMLFDAESGDLLFRHNLYVDAAQARPIAHRRDKRRRFP